MRILVVGAGATGGYFGGRLLEAGRDVRFLVRPRRAALLAEVGLSIRSPFGDLDYPAPPTILSEELRKPFDLVLLSCKAYDLASAVEAFAPAVGPGTMVLSVLNGLAHLDVLDARFGSERVLGGHCFISTVLDSHNHIQHLSDKHVLFFGERDGSLSPRIHAVESLMTGARFEPRLSRKILQEMWDKWVFIAAGASATCLLRASIGDIVAAGAADIAAGLLDECNAIARAEGFEPSRELTDRSRGQLTAAGSSFTTSMFRDIENRAPIEADHLVGDMLRRGREHHLTTPLLRLAFAHLKTYEARRKRELEGNTFA